MTLSLKQKYIKTISINNIDKQDEKAERNRSTWWN